MEQNDSAGKAELRASAKLACSMVYGVDRGSVLSHLNSVKFDIENMVVPNPHK